MAKMLFEPTAVPAQDPMFGINPGRIVAQLSPSNWKQSAVVRDRGGERFYVYVTRRRNTEAFGGDVVYSVSTYRLSTGASVDFNLAFSTLAEAFGAANAGVPVMPEAVPAQGPEIQIVFFPKTR